MIRLTIALALAAAGLTAGEKTKTEVTRATSPAEDGKANSDKVPEVVALSAQFQRIVVLRFKYQADLLAGIEKAIRDEKIKNAVVLSGIGSVRNYHYHSVSNRDFPSKNIYVKDAKEPADIVAINGYVINGKVHAHMTLTDDEKAFGGHIEPQTNVFTFAVLTLGVFGDGVDLSRFDDKTWR